MELIDFRGLNCYYNCIVTIANARGIDYSLSFARLWSETDFEYNPYRKVFLTGRLPANLAAAGAKLVRLTTDTSADAAKRLTEFAANELAVIGTDAFFIPWNPLYSLHHGPHFFIAAVTADEELTCWDPTYNAADVKLTRDAVVRYAFDISRLDQVPPAPEGSNTEEAREVLLVLPRLREELTRAVRSCTAAPRDKNLLLAKYVDALISNRRLFAFYLKSRGAAPGTPFADADFFKAWQAVKNGVYKLAVAPSPAVADEICAMLDALFARETAFARELLTKSYLFSTVL